MTRLLLDLLLMLTLILVASELFTNALEHLGQKLKISEGVTGSLFAAISTALPETMVPLLAIFAGAGSLQVNEEIGVGSILGAPLMLSTLSTGLMAFATLKSRGIKGLINPEPEGFKRDVDFFLFAFFLASIAMFIPSDARYLKVGVSLVLCLTYFIYIMLTLRASAHLVESGHGTEAENTMFLARTGLPTNMITIIAQLAIGLGLLIFGAKGFIAGVEGVSHLFHISPLLLSLLIIPIATELPEKVNSILWIRRGKDTLAFGNITGAMVFQGTLLPAMGIMLTPWEPRSEVVMGVGITLVAAGWLRLHAKDKGLPVWTLLLNGGLYLFFLVSTIIRSQAG